jgi:hypothetical protein
MLDFEHLHLRERFMGIRRILIFALLLVLGPIFSAAMAMAQESHEIDTSWPREIESDLGKIIIYQPQLDSLDGNTLTGRAAISLQGPDKKEPVFGALWFKAEVSVDRDAGLMTLEDTKITRVKFPDSTPEDMQKISERIEAPANTWDIVMTLEQAETSLAASRKEVASTENLKSDPPVIIFSQKPAVLVSFDGEPETRSIKDSPYEQVVNTAFLIVRDKNSGNFYLSNGQTWYIAKNPKGPWSVTTNTPADIKNFVKPDPDAEPQTGPPPQIITATVPTELIVTSGAPNWTALTGNQLLYVSNTESTFIKEIATNKYYLLLSGRWFSSQLLDGPWTYERSDTLPASFKQIPPASAVGDALAAVAGTNEADDAEADAEIPQTAAIKRDEAKTEVTYDGAPQFQQIPSTEVQYAVNTSSSVLKIGDRYYVCDNGVWFAGLTPNGPWVVADSVPDAVQTIPPSAPVYNVRYVHIYDATPQIVYVGYTPGYIGTYRYYGTVVYGTGWYYRPWIGPVYYYPRPYTWGFNVIYNPWTGGWGFALGYSTPFINVSIGWRSSYYRYPPYWGGGGWWGPGGYRPIYRPLPGYRPPYRPPRNVVVIQPIYRPGRPGNRPGYPNRPGRPGRPTPYTRDNLYARPGISDRVKTDYRPKGKTPKPATRLPNNVYTDKDGNVYRRGNNGKWDKRENGKWTKPAPANPGTQPTKPGTRPTPGTPGTKPAPERPGTRPAPGTPGTKPAPEKPGTRPAPQPKPGQPSIQPAPNPSQPKPTNPPTTRPSKPTPQPQPGQPSIQPAPNPSQPKPANPQPKPEQPSTRPAPGQPRPRPTTPPSTQPSNPSIQPAPSNPQPRPMQPSTQPAPTKPSNPYTRPAPPPAPGLDREADARNRARTSRPAPTPAPSNNSRQAQPQQSNSRNSSSGGQPAKGQPSNQRQR